MAAAAPSLETCHNHLVAQAKSRLAPACSAGFSIK
jgi:hypothetical protein